VTGSYDYGCASCRCSAAPGNYRFVPGETQLRGCLEGTGKDSEEGREKECDPANL